MSQVKTVNQAYVDAKTAQEYALRVLISQTDIPTLQIQVEAFEDVMNGLSGELQNIEPDQLSEIRLDNSALVSFGLEQGVTISLDDSLVAKEDRIRDSNDPTIIQAKKLYPRTDSVQVFPTEIVKSEDENSGNNDVLPVEETDEETENEQNETIDPLFDTIDDETELAIEEYTPIAMDQNETLPYLPDGMILLAKEAASNTNGLQAGLTAFSYNPIAEVIDDTIELLLYYTANNYTNLNVALSGIYSNPAINVEYKAFQDSIAGNDGLSGSIAQLDTFKDHTNRLSGLVLDEDSPNAGTTDETTIDNLALNDYSGGPTVIFTFDSRKFRSAKYMIQASSDITDRGHQATELYILHDNHQAFTTVVTSIYTQEPFVTYTSRLANNTIEVLANTTVDNTNFVVSGTRLRIAKNSQTYPEISQQSIIQLHETISVFLDDGIDYVSLMSGSVLKPYLVANLAREFRDYLANFADPVFVSQSDAAKQSALLAAATIMRTRRQEIQDSIDLDWTNFVETRKLSEALDIAYNLTVSYTDASGNSIPSVTLNNRAIQAIEDAIVVDEEDEE